MSSRIEDERPIPPHTASRDRTAKRGVHSPLHYLRNGYGDEEEPYRRCRGRSRRRAARVSRSRSNRRAARSCRSRSRSRSRIAECESCQPRLSSVSDDEGYQESAEDEFTVRIDGYNDLFNCSQCDDLLSSLLLNRISPSTLS